MPYLLRFVIAPLLSLDEKAKLALMQQDTCAALGALLAMRAGDIIKRPNTLDIKFPMGKIIILRVCCVGMLPAPHLFFRLGDDYE